MKKILIKSKAYGNHYLIIDDEDYEIISKYKWSLKKSNNTYYARHGYPKKIYIHRFLTRYKMTDHINGNGLDNRRNNLRECSQKENSRNSKTRKHSSKYKGVHWDKVNLKWTAQIMVDYKQIKLGRFVKEIEAALAYIEAAETYHGKFARY